MTDIREQVLNRLSSTPFSWNSVPGLLLILFLLGICVFLARKAVRAVLTGVGLVVFLQVMHIIAYSTPIGDAWPFIKSLFGFAPLLSLAQLVVGTPVGNALVSAEVFLEYVIGNAFSAFYYFIVVVGAFIWKTIQQVCQA